MVTRLLTIREVQRIVGLSVPTIYRRIHAGKFPVPLKTGGNSVRFRDDEIQAWIEALPAADLQTTTSGGP